VSNTAKAYLARQAEAVGAPSRTSDFGGMIEYYYEFVPRFLKKRNGEPVGRRAAQKLARKYNFPLVRIGYCIYIDVDLAAERLRRAQLGDDRQPRRRGRPRKNGAPDLASPLVRLAAADDDAG
jgi:hypothetical protein